MNFNFKFTKKSFFIAILLEELIIVDITTIGFYKLILVVLGQEKKLERPISIRLHMIRKITFLKKISGS